MKDIYFLFLKENINIKDILESFLKEDIPLGIDYSSFILKESIKAQIILKEPAIVCGLPLLQILFEDILKVNISFKINEGDFIKHTPCAITTLEGEASKILKGERLALNILQRLSGIATLTKNYVNEIRKVTKHTKLLNTRKTTPGFRIFEKYATLVGGASCHRFSLSDGVMIKDNHIKIFGSVSKAIKEIKKYMPVTLKLEVEVESKKQIEDILKENLQNDVDILMLDNFSLEDLKIIIPFVRKHFPKTLIEVSGGVTLENISEIAKLEPDFISTSKTIMSAKAKDLSLEVL